MKFSAPRVVLFSLAGALAGWLAGRGLRASSNALEQTGKPSPAILANTLSPVSATNKTRRIVFSGGVPASLNTLAAELDSTWFPSEQWKAARLQQLERCSNGQLAALTRGLLERKGASPASRAMASLTLLLLAERDPGMAIDTACAWTASLSGPAELRNAGTLRTLVENVCGRNGGDDAQLRSWLGRENNVLSGALMAWLTKSDPERAVALWTELQPVKGDLIASLNATSMFVSALASAGRIDLAFTLAESGKNPLPKNTAMLLACRSVTDSQIPDLLARLTAGKYSEHIWSLFASRFGEVDPQAALTWAQTLTDFPKAAAAMEGIAKSVTRDHPELVKSWLSSMPDGTVRNGLLSGALWELPTSDAKVILSAEKSLPAGLSGLSMVASDIYRADPVAASEWAASLPDGQGKEHVLKRFDQDRSADDPRAFLDDLAKLPDSDERQTLIRSASAFYAEARSIEWLAWCQTLPPEDRNDLLNENWGRLRSNAPAAAARMPSFLHAAAILGTATSVILLALQARDRLDSRSMEPRSLITRLSSSSADLERLTSFPTGRASGGDVNPAHRDTHFSASSYLCRFLEPKVFGSEGNLLLESFMRGGLTQKECEDLRRAYGDAIEKVKGVEKALSTISKTGNESVIVVPAYADTLNVIRSRFRDEVREHLAEQNCWAADLALVSSVLTEGFEAREVSAVLDGARIGSMITTSHSSRTSWDGLRLLRDRYDHLVDVDALLKALPTEAVK